MTLSTWQKRIFLVLFAILLPLTIAEILLRSIQYGSMAFWQPDSVYGKALITNGEGWYTNEGRAFVRINNQGYHDQNHLIEKPENVFRIAVLGDSFVEAIQLPYQKSFWYLLSDRLQTCPALLGKIIETFGFGVSNYGTGHQLLILKQDVLKYQSDEVVLSFYQGNDITDNSSFYYSGPSPSFAVEDNELIIGNEFRQNTEFKKRTWLVKLGYYRMILKFRVFELIRNSIKLFPRFFKHPSQSRINRTDRGLIDPMLQKNMFKNIKMPGC